MRVKSSLISLSAAIAICLTASINSLSGQSLRTSDLGRTVNQTGTAAERAGDNPYAEVEYDENGNPITPEGEKKDSTVVREIKPLESYFFTDSLRAQRITQWSIDPYGNNLKFNVVDTLLDSFNVDMPFLKEDVGDANVGIMGGVSVPHNYFRRPTSNNFSFANSYYAYIFTPYNAPHYNTKRPYTVLGYVTAGQKKYAEEDLKVIHAQQVAPSTGFNITYNNLGDKNIYNWHRSKTKDLSIAVAHTGKKYTIQAGFINNNIYQRENGGLVEDWHVADTLYESTLNIPMKMTDALNEMKNSAVYVMQSLGVPLKGLAEEDFTIADRPAFFIGHLIEWNRWQKSYSDTYAGTTYKVVGRDGTTLDTRNAYENWYINPSQTRDTLSESVLTNSLFVQLQPYNRGGVVGTVDGGIGYDHRRYYQFRMSDYLQGNGIVKKNTYYLFAQGSGSIKRYFGWNATMRYNIAGYRAGDVMVDGKAAMNLFVKGSPISLSGRITFDLEEPSYWDQSYFSNHFAWSNNFSKQNRTTIGATLRVPAIGFEASFNQAVLGNTVYYGANMLPSQYESAVSVTSAYLREDLRLGGFHLNHRVMWQYSSVESVVSVPTLAVNLSYYYQFEPVKNILTLKFGLDGWYQTRYYAPGYNPATTTFYNQRDTMVGGYPYCNAFLVAKWKRMRIILQYQHANDRLFEENYSPFSVPHYPFNKAVFKYGISWNFYD